MALDVNSYFDYGNADAMADDSLIDQYQRFVVLSAGGQFAVATTGADANVFGVLRDNVAVGEVPPVRTGSIAYIFAGADVSPGDFITNDTTGRARVAVAGEAIHGQVVEKGGSVGDEIKVNLSLGKATA